MTRNWFGAALVMALGAMTVPAAQARELLVAPPLPNFVVGHQAANKNQSIKEEVPQG